MRKKKKKKNEIAISTFNLRPPASPFSPSSAPLLRSILFFLGNSFHGYVHPPTYFHCITCHFGCFSCLLTLVFVLFSFFSFTLFQLLSLHFFTFFTSFPSPLAPLSHLHPHRLLYSLHYTVTHFLTPSPPLIQLPWLQLNAAHSQHNNKIDVDSLLCSPANPSLPSPLSVRAHSRPVHTPHPLFSHLSHNNHSNTSATRQI